MRRISAFICAVLIMFFLPLFALAHPGRTDASGGHRDSASGEYHYHHGYPEHQHTDIDGDGVLDCPYRSSETTNTHAVTTKTTVSPAVSSILAASATPLPSPIVKAAESQTKQSGNSTSLEDNVVLSFILAGFVALLTVCLFRSSDNHERKVSNLQKQIQNLSNEIHLLQQKLKESESNNQQNSLAASKAQSELEADRNYYKRNLEDISSKLANVGSLIGDDAMKKAEAMRSRSLPVGIRFENGNPVTGIRTTDRPYGDYTVYLSQNSKIYHKSIGCSCSWKSAKHLYSLSDNFRPCLICHPASLPSSEDRQWYLDIVNAYYLYTRANHIQTGEFDNSSSQ